MATPDVDGTETGAPMDMSADTEPTEGGDPLKEIQKLTGKITQKMRDMGETFQPKDIKYVLNSIISAANMTTLPEADKNDIINKINGEEGGSVNEINIGEIQEPKRGFSYEFASRFTGTVLNTVEHPKYGKHKLTPEQIKYSDGQYKNALYQAIQLAIESGEIEEPNQTMGEVNMEGEHTARFRASGGQTVGENQINEQILSILEKARQNVRNNLNK
jgi:hypothetical protein